MTPFIYFDNEDGHQQDLAGREAEGRRRDHRSRPPSARSTNTARCRCSARSSATTPCSRPDKPVTIWGSTRNFGEWQSEPGGGRLQGALRVRRRHQEGHRRDAGHGGVEGHPAADEGRPEAVHAEGQFTIDGEMVHERVVTGIVFGDVWYVVAPAGKFTVPEVKPSGQIVRMIENQSKRDGKAAPSRYSVCVSRTPREIRRTARRATASLPTGRMRRAGGRARPPHCGKTGRPVGIIFMQAKRTSRSRTGSPLASSKTPRA
jgi:hypothetical protein